MITADRKPFFALIGNICAFYRRDFSDFLGNVWWEAMKQFDLKAVTDALNRHCVNPDVGQFMPMPADVVKMLQGSTQDSALVAWAKVDRALRTVGTYRSVVFEDALIHRILTEMGGWIALGMKEEKEWPFQKNEFVNRYRGYRGRSEVPEYPPVLIGIAEANNSKQGFQTEPPILIGNPQHAKQVMSLGSKKQILEFTQMDTVDANATLRLVHGAKA